MADLMLYAIKSLYKYSAFINAVLAGEAAAIVSWSHLVI